MENRYLEVEIKIAQLDQFYPQHNLILPSIGHLIFDTVQLMIH